MAKPIYKTCNSRKIVKVILFKSLFHVLANLLFFDDWIWKEFSPINPCEMCRQSSDTPQQLISCKYCPHIRDSYLFVHLFFRERWENEKVQSMVKARRRRVWVNKLMLVVRLVATYYFLFANSVSDSSVYHLFYIFANINIDVYIIQQQVVHFYEYVNG